MLGAGHPANHGVRRKVRQIYRRKGKSREAISSQDNLRKADKKQDKLRPGIIRKNSLRECVIIWELNGRPPKRTKSKRARTNNYTNVCFYLVFLVCLHAGKRT